MSASDGAHDPLDVIGGGAIGVAVGAALVPAIGPERIGRRGLAPAR